jgi:hypothetical protein
VVPTIDFLEHLPHALDIVVVQKPRLWILFILLKRYAKGVSYVDRLAIVLTQQYAYNALIG